MVDEKDVALIKTEKEPVIECSKCKQVMMFMHMLKNAVGKVACADIHECVKIICACIKP